jgi:hypothetical protein
MELRIGPPAAALLQRRIEDANLAWGRYNGTYTVPAGQFLTALPVWRRQVRACVCSACHLLSASSERMRCAARSSAGGNPTVGNFLDNIQFSVPAVACPTKVMALNTNPPPTTALP